MSDQSIADINNIISVSISVLTVYNFTILVSDDQEKKELSWRYKQYLKNPWNYFIFLVSRPMW